MKLSECKFGVLVQDDRGRVGMVKGITNNKTSSDLQERDDPDNAIPLVEWASGATTGIYHGNLKPFKG